MGDEFFQSSLERSQVCPCLRTHRTDQRQGTLVRVLFVTPFPANSFTSSYNSSISRCIRYPCLTRNKFLPMCPSVPHTHAWRCERTQFDLYWGQTCIEFINTSMVLLILFLVAGCSTVFFRMGRSSGSSSLEGSRSSLGHHMTR